MYRGKFCAQLSAVAVLLLATGSWAEFQVNTYAEHNQTHAAVAMNDAGDFVVVWRSHPADGRGGGVYARPFDAGGAALCDEFKVNSAPADVDNWTPAVAMGPSGDFVVAWVAPGESGTDVMARLFDRQGLTLTDEFRVCDLRPGVTQSMPSIAAGPTGNFVIVWVSRSADCRTAKCYVMGRLFGPDAAPLGDDFLVNEYPEDQDRPLGYWYAQGCWPDVGMDESGRFVVAWIRMGDTWNRPYGETIMFRRFEADATPADAVACVTCDLNSRWYGPSVAVDRSGEFAVVWASGPFPYDIVAQHFDPNGTATAEPYMVNATMEGNQGHPQVATNGQGEYLMVWDSQDYDGDCCGVCRQRCGRGPALLGDEETVNTYVIGRQWYPDVAMAADGACVVVWISERQDGSGYGVFAEVGPQ